MSFSSSTWAQLKNLTCEEIMRALKKDKWDLDTVNGSIHTFYKPNGRRVQIHFHPGKTYGPKMLKGILDDIAWTEDDLRRLKLIK